MIRWRNQATASPLRPLAEFLSRQPAAGAARLTAMLGEMPLVMVAEEAKRAVLRHLSESPLEQGGLLIGEAYAADAAAPDPMVTVVQVSVAVPSTDFSSSGVALRMESAVWEAARPALAEGCLVVGWYHSHPGLGAFFSDTDRRTQRAFFAHPYSLGWVVDPLLGEEAWFLGAGALQLAPARILVTQPNESESVPLAPREESGNG